MSRETVWPITLGKIDSKVRMEDSLMSRIVKILSICILYVVVSMAAFGQGAHYTYPYSIECPDRLVQSGETVTINAKFPGGHTGDFYEPVYSWSVSMGTVVSGQGTPSIRLEVPNDEGGSINVILDRSLSIARYWRAKNGELLDGMRSRKCCADCEMASACTARTFSPAG